MAGDEILVFGARQVLLISPSIFTRFSRSKLIKHSFVAYSNLRWFDLQRGKWLGRGFGDRVHGKYFLYLRQFLPVSRGLN